MTKVPKQHVIQTIIDDDIWDDDWDRIDDDYWPEYWRDVAIGEMSWQWYMQLVNHKDWHYVIVNGNYKYLSVVTWLDDNYPDCEYLHEINHFIFEDEAVATMVALKWV